MNIKRGFYGKQFPYRATAKKRDFQDKTATSYITFTFDGRNLSFSTKSQLYSASLCLLQMPHKSGAKAAVYLFRKFMFYFTGGKTILRQQGNEIFLNALVLRAVFMDFRLLKWPFAFTITQPNAPIEKSNKEIALLLLTYLLARFIAACFNGLICSVTKYGIDSPKINSGNWEELCKFVHFAN